MQSAIDQIVDSIDFDRDGFIGQFGKPKDAASALGELSDLLESSPSAKLAAALKGVVDLLSRADPAKVPRKPNWLSRFTGAGLEQKLDYEEARQGVEVMLTKADGLADEARALVARVGAEVATQVDVAGDLDRHIKAGQAYLAANPTAGVPAPGAMTFEASPRERFSRRLTNLAALLASHEMGTLQLKLARAQLSDLIERYDEVRQVLVPAWRQHALAVANRANLDAPALAAANQAHAALSASLAKCLEPPTRH